MTSFPSPPRFAHLYLDSHAEHHVPEPTAFNKRYRVQIAGMFEVKEVSEWLRDNARGRYTSVYQSCFLNSISYEMLEHRNVIVHFENESDALLFKLTWSGQ